ncbi:trypsin-like peptidase domain-containing protein [Streptomyces sp. HNM0663]|uniref:Trypsin-like peptidase domain-containing protein n=1 Tax=Streptomyces chengmaiensis TaxID=3040919 RepID=A0ABT6HG39_9ACTN|nr:trypsin-like peptidase domain-containing protein [Streptomyces chengmaiensis]MDH2387235.1 trypsin-like peptidase domain-containing protein [Streptomyces chengmaiensis]
MSPLDALVRRAVVCISGPAAGYDERSAGYWGSGFFIAPTWVLTCAHVVGKGGGAVWSGEDAVDVSWAGGTSAGTVRLALPVPDPPGAAFHRWPAPDLALVQVPEAADAECVWLGDRPGPFSGARISLHGWSLETGTRSYRPAAGQVTGADGPLMLLRGERPVEGTSGGPVVDTARGAVIGVCKARDEADPTAGIAVPVTALHGLYELPGGELLHEVISAHDRHHLHRHRALGGDSSWIDAHFELRANRFGGFDPGRRAHLFGRLAELTPPTTPGEVAALVDAVRRRKMLGRCQGLDEAAPRTWREGVGLLYEPDETQELMAVALYAAKVVAAVRARGHAGDAAALRELGDWVRETVEPLIGVRQEVQTILDGSGPVADVSWPRPRAAVRVVIRPRSYGDRHPWEVKLDFGRGEVTGLSGDDTGTVRGKLRDALLQPIAEALGRCDVGDEPAAVEFVVPRELFDEPFHTWQLAPRRTPEGGTDPNGLPLGQRRFVVVRDLLRTTMAPTQEWQRRWAGVAEGPPTAVPLRAEVAREGAHTRRGESWHAAYDRLSGAAPESVAVFCGPVAAGEGAEAMDAALAAGYPVAIWRSLAAGHRDCAEFHQQAEKFVAAVRSAAGLDWPVRSLRIRTDDPGLQDPRMTWGRSIVLLYDSPEQLPEEDGPIREPCPAPPMTW